MDTTPTEGYVILTPKGMAIMAAIQAGLLPDPNDDQAFARFERFWSLFESKLSQNGLQIGKDPRPMLNQQRKERTKQNIKYLEPAICMFIGFLLAKLLLFLLKFL